MAWITKFPVYILGGEVELNPATRTQLDATETRDLSAPVRVDVDPAYTGTVSIQYFTAGPTYTTIRVLSGGEFDILEEFEFVSDVYILPSLGTAGTYLRWSAGTDVSS